MAVAIALVAGIVASTTFAVRESAQRRKAERARADLEKVVDFQARMISGIDPAGMGERLISDLRGRLEKAGPGGEPAGEPAGTRRPQLDRALAGVNGTDAALRILDEEILGRAARVIETEFAGEPLIEARLRLSLGTTYGDIGLYDRAGPHLDRSLELRRNELGDDDPDTLRSLRAVASNHLRAGRYEEAEAAFRAAVEGMSRVLGPEDAETLTARQSLGNVYRKQGRYDDAEALYLDVLQARRHTLGPEALQTLDTMQSLAMLYGETGRHSQAEPLLAEALEVRKRELSPDNPLTLLTIEQLAENQSNLGRLEEAEKLYLGLLEAQRRVRGSEHPDLIVTLNNLAKVYVDQGRLDDAVPAFTEALRIGRLKRGPDRLDNVMMMVNLASVQQRAGHLAEAERLYLDGLEAMNRTAGPDHPSTLLTRVNLGIVYFQEGRQREAAEAIRAAAENARAPVQVKLQAALFFRRYASPRDTAAAVRYASQAVEMTGRGEFPSLQALASALADDGRTGESRSVWEEIVAHPDAGPLQFNEYAWFLLTSAGGGPPEATTALEFALKAVEPPGDKNPDYLDTLALAYHRTGRDDKAVETIEHALAIIAPNDAARRGPFMKRLEEYRAATARGDL